MDLTTQVAYLLTVVLCAAVFGVTATLVAARIERVSENLKQFASHAIDQNMALANTAMANARSAISIGGIPLAVKEAELALEKQKAQNEATRQQLGRDMFEHARRHGAPATNGADANAKS